MPNIPEQRMCAVADENDHNTGMDYDGEHVPWVGSDLVSKGEW